MRIRKLSAAQGLVWVREAINIGARNPRAVFGAAALFVAALYGFAALAVLPVAIGLQGRDQITLREAFGVAIPLFIVLTLAMPLLLAGLMHVVREAEAGRPVRARDLFAPFTQGRARPLVMLGLVQVALNLVGALLVIGLAGSDYWPEYFKALQGAMSGHVAVPPQPDHPVLMMLVQLVFNYFSYALVLLCVPLVAFSNTGLAESLRLGLRASVANVGANLLASVLFIAALVMAALVVGVAALVVGLVASLVHPLLGAMLSLIVYAGFAVVVLVVLVAISYVAWRDTFDTGDATAAVVPGPAHIEA
ncbi:MAG: hypothetical protein EPO46_06420 [Lysobacter sp.]|nr:MAG: hypothetical protein EPO46_06420 [Lysobacter sp.]